MPGRRPHRRIPVAALLGLIMLVPPLASGQGGASLFVTGRPQPGKPLTFEVTAPSGSQVWLGADTVPGPATAGGLTVGLGLSPALILLPLGTGGPANAAITFVVPAAPSPVGQTVHVQALAVTAAGVPLLTNTVAVGFAPPQPLAAVDDFTYQLQGPGGADLDLAPIAASAFDLCVIDHSRDGLLEFTPAEIAALRSPADPGRIRLAYMSIGEAEDYRWYWGAISPSLLASANPQWPGNHKVRYWMPEWKEVLLYGNAAVGASYLDRVLAQGFDGVWLDIVDAFEFFGPAEEGGTNEKRDAAREMVRLILEIAFHARITRGRPDFLVLPQNGSSIFDAAWYPADTLTPGFASPAALAAHEKARGVATLDGIGAEDTFYFGPNAMNNALNPQTAVLADLGQFTAAGLPVFAVEYVSQATKVASLYTNLAPAYGFIPYATVRSLSVMTINAGFPPN